MDGAPDSELLSRAADGSDSAFATLIDRYAPPLYDFAARLTRDRDEAFEVVRETFLVALRDMRTHDVIQHPRPWLFSLARANILAIVDGSPRASHMLEGRGQDAEALDRVEASRLQPETDLAVANAMAPIAWESAAMLETRQLGILLLLLRERLPAEQAVEVFGIRPQNAAVIRPRIERAAEDNAWALFVLRDPSRRCAGLDAMLPLLEAGSIPVQIVTSGPDNALEAIHRMHVEAIHSATHRAWLTTPYFVPGEPALMALTSAALRGVDVRLLVPRRSDSAIVSAAARSYFDELIAAGVKVWEYRARMLHSKTLVVDDHCAMIGTANFDNRSFRLNFEVCAVVYGPALAGPLAAQFETDLHSSGAVRANRRQSFWRRLGDAIARLFSPLL